MYIYIYVCVYIYTYTHTHKHKRAEHPKRVHCTACAKPSRSIALAKEPGAGKFRTAVRSEAQAAVSHVVILYRLVD